MLREQRGLIILLTIHLVPVCRPSTVWNDSAGRQIDARNRSPSFWRRFMVGLSQDTGNAQRTIVRHRTLSPLSLVWHAADGRSCSGGVLTSNKTRYVSKSRQFIASFDTARHRAKDLLLTLLSAVSSLQLTIRSRPNNYKTAYGTHATNSFILRL